MLATLAAADFYIHAAAIDVYAIILLCLPSPPPYYTPYVTPSVHATPLCVYRVSLRLYRCCRCHAELLRHRLFAAIMFFDIAFSLVAMRAIPLLDIIIRHFRYRWLRCRCHAAITLYYFDYTLLILPLLSMILLSRLLSQPPAWSRTIRRYREPPPHAGASLPSPRRLPPRYAIRINTRLCFIYIDDFFLHSLFIRYRFSSMIRHYCFDILRLLRYAATTPPSTPLSPPSSSSTLRWSFQLLFYFSLCGMLVMKAV